MRFVQHIPAFIDTGGPPIEFTFSTAEELLASTYVALWGRDKNFHRYSIHREHDPPMLMVEQDAGKKWWVLGRIYDADPAELKKIPAWEMR